jgi:hypothetical protein
VKLNSGGFDRDPAGRPLATGQDSSPPEHRPPDRRPDGGLDLGKLLRASREARAPQVEGAALGRGGAATRHETTAGRVESTSPARRPDGGLDLGKLVRASKEAKAQQIEEAALGRGDAATLRENPEARSKVAQAVARGHAQAGDGQRQDQGQAGPTRESGQGPQRSAGRYGVLSR